MRLLRPRRRLFLLLGVSLLIVATPVAVFAANHNFNGAADRQSAKWTTSGGSISGTGWHNVPGLGITRCTVREVSETATLTVSGGPVRFRAVIDGVPEAPMKPGIVRFVPNDAMIFSRTLAASRSRSLCSQFCLRRTRTSSRSEAAESPAVTGRRTRSAWRRSRNLSCCRAGSTPNTDGRAAG